MATIKKFEDLEIWQLARSLSLDIFNIISTPDLKKDFSLKNQITRSSGSIMDNIAEGFERSGRKEFKQFLAIAKGSCGETRSQLYRMLDQGFINTDQFNAIEEKCLLLSKRINAFIAYLNNTEIEGTKHQSRD